MKTQPKKKKRTSWFTLPAGWDAEAKSTMLKKKRERKRERGTCWDLDMIFLKGIEYANFIFAHKGTSMYLMLH